MTLQYDGVRPVVEGTLEGDTWTTTARNVWEGDSYYSPLVLRLLPSGGYNYLADGLGSTRQLMRHSDHTITDTYSYDAFGNTLSATGTTDNPYRYVGGLGYRQSGSAIHAGARSYCPYLGVWASRDPLRFRYNLGRALSYGYADQSPVLLTDPEGLAPKPKCKRTGPFPIPGVPGEPYDPDYGWVGPPPPGGGRRQRCARETWHFYHDA